jgi:hypothetical protein
MKLTVEINMDNAAFETVQDRAVEVARLLTEVSFTFGKYGTLDTMKLRDINGNTVGVATVTA